MCPILSLVEALEAVLAATLNVLEFFVLRMEGPI
jgi:hypothetical protein